MSMTWEVAKWSLAIVFVVNSLYVFIGQVLESGVRKPNWRISTTTFQTPKQNSSDLNIFRLFMCAYEFILISQKSLDKIKPAGGRTQRITKSEKNYFYREQFYEIH